MAVTSGFYNSVNHDRKYNAMQIANLLDGVINDGVFMTVGDHFAVTENSGMTIKVGIGRAWFNMTWLYNDSQLVLAVEPSDLTLPRIDAVVVEVNTSQEVRAGTIKIIKGAPNASPVAPTMVSTATIHQYPLALISVGANVSSITADKITNKVGTADCPYVNGILTTSTVEAQAASWESTFNTWFDGVKGTLNGDIAGNLLNLINDRVKYTDKATKAEAEAGFNDVKYMSPMNVRDAIYADKKVGDILVTERTNLSDDWIFCNGMPYDTATYPNLSSVIDKRKFSDFWIPGPAIFGNVIVVGNGTVAVFYKTSTTTMTVYTPDNPSNLLGTWTATTLYASSFGANAQFASYVDPCFVDGKFIIGLDGTSNTSVWGYMFSTNGRSWGNITFTAPLSAATFFRGIVKHGSNYGVMGLASQTVHIYSNTLLNGGTWTLRANTMSANSPANFSSADGNVYFTDENGYVRYTSSLLSAGGSYTMVRPLYQNNLGGIFYSNGYWWMKAGSNCQRGPSLFSAAGWTAQTLSLYPSKQLSDGTFAGAASGQWYLYSFATDKKTAIAFFSETFNAIEHVPGYGWIAVNITGECRVLPENGTPYFGGESYFYIRGK